MTFIHDQELTTGIIENTFIFRLNFDKTSLPLATFLMCDRQHLSHACHRNYKHLFLRISELYKFDAEHATK